VVFQVLGPRQKTKTEKERGNYSTSTRLAVALVKLAWKPQTDDVSSGSHQQWGRGGLGWRNAFFRETFSTSFCSLDLRKVISQNILGS
jgi:hypothetical protein